MNFPSRLPPGPWLAVGALSLAAALGGAPARATSTAPVDEAVAILQRRYVEFDKLDPRPAKIPDLIAQSHGGIRLLGHDQPAAGGAARKGAMFAALLRDNAIFWRLGGFTPEAGWPALSRQLADWAGKGAEGIVLDLRGNVSPNDYEGAARVAGFFLARGTVLFQAREADGAPRVYPSPSAGVLPRLPLLVLVNRETAGAPEALAAVLHGAGALVIGQPTAGTAAIYGEDQLSSGEVIQYAADPILLPDGAPLWRHPIEPDLAVAAGGTQETEALQAIDRHDVDAVIREAAPRHRLSEAALMEGDNPEWDAFLAAHEAAGPKAAETKPPAQDAALMAALDSLKAIAAVQPRPAAPPVVTAARDAAPAVQ